MYNKAKTFIQTETREKGEVDPDKKAIRDLIKKVNKVIQTVGNVFWLSPSSDTFKDALSVINNDEDKNQAYFDMVGVSSGIVLYDLYEFLPEKMMDLLFLTQGKRNRISVVASHPSVFKDLNLSTCFS